MTEAEMAENNVRPNNKRTALVLLSIAVAFFIGVIVRRWLYGG